MNYTGPCYELNLDGLVGPTHNYAGLGIGNIASIKHAKNISNPKEAALQGLKKMYFLHKKGIKQAVMPPHARPNLNFLKHLGFRGDISKQLNDAYKFNPQILAAAFSASSMWTANCATVSASTDTLDGKVHFTAANLVQSLHRYPESAFSAKLLESIFNDPDKFVHHKPLPNTIFFSDEGAANHNRLAKNHSSKGLNLFVYGISALHKNEEKPKHFPARQTLEAHQMIAYNHKLAPELIVFIQQNPEAIDQGVFHNDVISVANENLFLFHEKAFVNQDKVLKDILNKVEFTPYLIEIKEDDISLETAVNTYLFNSQIISLPDQSMLLLAPIECEENAGIKSIINSWLGDSANPINNVHYFNLRQSMNNGGGPACLRFRVVLNQEELNSMNKNVLLSDELYSKLEQWISKHYRDTLSMDDLRDPLLAEESMQALDELTKILNLNGIYPFQN